MSPIYDILINANKLSVLFYQGRQYNDAISLINNIIFKFKKFFPEDYISLYILEIQLKIFEAKNYEKDSYIPSLSLKISDNSELLFLSHNLSLLQTNYTFNEKNSSHHVECSTSIGKKAIPEESFKNNHCTKNKCLDCQLVNDLKDTLSTTNILYSNSLRELYDKTKDIVNMLLDKRNYEKAESIYKLLIKSFEKHLEKDSELLLILYDNMGLILYKNKKISEAEIYLKKVYLGYESKYGQHDTNTARALFNYGNIQFILKKYSESLVKYTKCILIFEKIYGVENLQIIIVLENLAKLFEKIKNYDETEYICKKILLLYKIHNNDKYNLCKFEIEVNLVRIYSLNNKLREAEILAELTLNFFEENFGIDDNRCIYLIKLYLDVLIDLKKDLPNKKKSLLDKLMYLNSLPEKEYENNYFTEYDEFNTYDIMSYD